MKPAKLWVILSAFALIFTGVFLSQKQGARAPAPTEQSKSADYSPETKSEAKTEQEKLETAQVEPAKPTIDSATVALAPTAPTIPGATPGQKCFLFSFKHKVLASHPDNESCSHHNNIVKLPHQGVNPKSLCLRLNGKPVAFKTVKGKNDEFMIGPIAGPHAKITAQYCLDKESCAQDCKIPKDEFLSAIGAINGDEDNGSKKKNEKIAQWDPADASANNDVAQDIDGEVQRELAGGSSNDLKTFRDWIPGDAEAPSCGTSKAHTGDPSRS